MFSFAKPATAAELAERKRQTLQWLDFESASAHPDESALPQQPKIPDDALAYLELLARTEGVPSAERDSAAHISPKRAQALRAVLLEKGLITETSVPAGRGRPVKQFSLTPTGRKIQTENNGSTPQEGK